MVFRVNFRGVQNLACRISCELEQTESRCCRNNNSGSSNSRNGCKMQLPSHHSFRLVPSGIRVIDSHRLCQLCRVRTEVLFVDGSGLVDNKSHHTRGAILNRIGDEGESCAHLPIDNILLGSARCMSSLASENPKHVSIERNTLANLVGWEILPRVSDEWVDRAIGLIVGALPVQTIVPAFIANQFLCELIRRAGEILFFRID